MSTASLPGDVEVALLRLCCIADEAATVLRRTAYSALVRDSNDCALVLADPQGVVIAENGFGPPLFLGVLGSTLRAMLAVVPRDQWQPGDRVVTNDPWLTAGHTLDLAMAAPIFHQGRIAGFSVSIAHLPDIGGVAFGADSRSLHEEGLLIPPAHWVRAGREDPLLLALLRANTRVPDQVIGDIRAQSAAHALCARGVAALLEETGADELGPLSQLLQARADAAMRRAIAALPEGRWQAETWADGAAGRPTRLACAISIGGGRLLVDFAGSSAASPVAVNAVLAFTRAMTLYALKCALDPAGPRNEGAFASIDVAAPPGSILNALRPAPTLARQLTGQIVPGAVFACLAQIIPDRVIADAGNAPTLRAQLTGTLADGRAFSTLLMGCGGYGAAAALDGHACLAFPGNTGWGSTETIERDAPLLIRRKALVPDSGGAGRQRGGLGQEIEVELRTEAPAALSLMADRLVNPPQGLAGGRPGLGVALHLADGTVLDPKGRTELAPGSRMILRFAGGGGFGDPRARDGAAVARDLAAGYVTPEGALRDYGVTA